MRKCKILVLVLAGNTRRSNINLKYQKMTWQKKHEDIEIVTYSGGSNFEFKNNNLILNVSDNYKDISEKTREAFLWISKNIDFDYLIRTNTSSYIDLENLKKFCDRNNITNLYRGRILKYQLNNLNIHYASGDEVLLSKDTFDKIIKNINFWDINLPDDVSIGKLMNKLNIVLENSNSIQFNVNLFKKKTITHEYHFRCRVDSPYYFPRFLDKLLLLYIHKNLQNKNISILLRFITGITFQFCRLFAFKKHKDYFNYYFWKLLKIIIKTDKLKKILN